MNVKISEHAKQRMDERGVSEEQVRAFFDSNEPITFIDYAFPKEVIMTNKELALALEREYDESGDNAGIAMPPAPSIAEAVATVKKRKTKVGTSFDPGVLEAFKAKAERVGIPYQTLLNSVVKRYTESKLDIEVA